MYPLTGGFMDVTEKGGLWGSLLREIGGKTLKKGRDYLDDLGVASLAAGDTVADKEGYITETFGPHREDIDEYIEGPGESEVIYSPHADTYYDRAEGLDFEDDPDQPYVAPDDYVETDFGDFYIDEDTLAPPYQEPFDDSLADWYEPEEVIESPGPIDRHPDKYPISREAGQPPLGAVDVTGDPTRRRDVGYDITASDLDVAPSPFPNIVDMDYWNWVDQFYDTHNPDGTPKADPRVIPGGGTSYVDDFADVVGEEVPPALPPYEGREFGLGQFINEMPTSRKSDWEDYLEYVQRLGDMEAGYHKQKLTYDEWHNMMRRRR
jgi:hypothetical protein